MSQESLEEAITEGLQFMEQDGIKELYNKYGNDTTKLLNRSTNTTCKAA